MREAALAGYSVVITDRGRPLATIAPYVDLDERRSFRDRELSPEFAAVQKRSISGDSADGISDDRER